MDCTLEEVGLKLVMMEADKQAKKGTCEMNPCKPGHRALPTDLKGSSEATDCGLCYATKANRLLPALCKEPALSSRLGTARELIAPTGPTAVESRTRGRRLAFVYPRR